MALKVCIVTTSYPRSNKDSSGAFIKDCVDALSVAGISGAVVAPGDESSLDIEQQGSFNVYRPRYVGGTLAYGLGILPNLKKSPIKVLQVPFMLYSMLRKTLEAGRSCDLLHAQWIVSGIITCCAARLLGKPYIVSVRGQDARLLELPVAAILFRWILARAQAVHVVSDVLFKQVSAYVAPSKLSLIYNGVRTSRKKNSSEEKLALVPYGLDPGAKYLIYVGRRIELKGVERLFPLLSLPRLKNHTLICFGPSEADYDDYLMKQASHLGISPRLKLFAELPPNCVSEILYSADYVVSGSYSEGRPNIVLEALSQGKVCLLSNIPAHQEIAKNCRAVLVFDAHGLPDLEEKLASLEPHGYANAAIVYAEQFSWENCVKQLSEVYTKCLQERA